MNIKKRDLIAFAVGVVATGLVGVASMAIGGDDGWGEHGRFGEHGMMGGRGFGGDDQNGPVGGPMRGHGFGQFNNGQNGPQNNQNTPAPSVTPSK